MAEQTIVWTALPNGTSGGGKTLRLSVHVAPRLSGTFLHVKDAQSPGYVPLSEFSDFVGWASADITFTVHLGAAAPLEAAPGPVRRPDLWAALFKPTTNVQPYSWDEVWTDPSQGRLVSYPVARLRAFLAGMYATVARQSPSEWPSLETLGRAGLSQVPSAGRETGALAPGEDLAAVLASLDDLYDRRLGAIPPGAATTPAQDIALAGAFLAPFAPSSGLTRQKELEPLGAVRTGKGGFHPTVPTFEFHQALSLLANHPPLARLLGLVLDLEVPRPPGLPASFAVSVEPTWHPRTQTTNVSPLTMTSGASFRPQERPGQPELAGGYARLGQSGFDVIEVDVDGAAMKTSNFAAGVRNAMVRRAADTPTTYALPSLRSAGLSLALSGNAYALGQSLLAANDINNQLQSSPPPTLYAEDVTRGYTVDVWDDRSSTWHTLCGRVAAPGTGGYRVGDPVSVVAVPAGDEGWVQLGTTSAATDAPQGAAPAPPSGEQRVPETLFRWSGWSLVAPRPGAHLPAGPSGGLSTEEQSSLAPGLDVSISYAAAPGTLPVLRFGRRYRFQARAVDLAGNHVGLRARAAPAPLVSTPATTYLRFEPVASPLLLFKAPRTAGEHLELLVVRSNYDVPDSSPSIVACERHVVPPPVAEEMAEAHGRLDGPDGRPQPSLYGMLAGRASATYNDPTVVAANGGRPDPATLGQLYFSADQLSVPYLPDPMGRAAAFLGLPGEPPGPEPLQVPFFAQPSDWPAARSFRLVLRPGGQAPERPNAANSWALSVFVPKGAVQAVRMSCSLEPADVELMGLWAWLSGSPMTPGERAGLAELITWGRHWMFTPFREVLLVHAVRQPLIAPHFGHLVAERSLGLTYANLSDPHVTVDHRSSARLDVLATWQEPFDDGSNPAGGTEITGRSRVGELVLAYEPGLRMAALQGMRHEFGDTKHRRVYYEALATTRFLEYFAETKEVVLSGAAPVVVSPAGLAPGATAVTGTGVLTKAVFRPGVDYTEDDSKGTIAREPAGSIPSGAKVVVRYVPPPTTRSSLEHPVAPSGPRGYLVSVPSSARPAPPDVRYVLPSFGWSSGTDKAGGPFSLRSGNTLRVYLGRPWWSSGEGELLGVVLYTHLDVGVEGQLQPLFSRAGGDPLWLTGATGSTLRLAQFPLAVARGSGLVLAEQTSTYKGMADVAGHAVSFDPAHKLWFCDVTIEAGASYWPFVRLGLVRYQPASLPTAEVSSVVQTDFAQLAPDRLAALSFPSSTEVSVTVSGPGVSAPRGAALPVSMRAFVEVQRPGVSDPDLQWELADPGATAGTALAAHAAGADVVWTGTVSLPVARGSKPMRVRLQEAEMVPLDAGAALAVNIGQRVTYLDTIVV